MPLLGLLIGVVTAALAARKGYSFMYWLLSMGLIGLIVLAFLPFANKPEQTSGEKAALIKRGNTIGLVMSGITLAGLAIQVAAVLNQWRLEWSLDAERVEGFRHRRSCGGGGLALCLRCPAVGFQAMPGEVAM